MERASIFTFDKAHVLTSIQHEYVVKLGKCPFCRKDSLRDFRIIAVTEWWVKQCEDCSRVFIV